MINIRYVGTKPNQAKPADAGRDLRANIKGPITVWPTMRAVIPTNLRIELPEDYAALVMSRSGLAANSGIIVLNSPGLIDAGYRGEINVILQNHGDRPFVVNPGDRVAQLMFIKVEHPEFIEVDALSLSERGEGGLGSTGVTQ